MKTIGLDEARAAKDRAKSIFAGSASVVGIGLTRVGDGYGVTYFPHITRGISLNFRGCPEPGQVS